MNLLSKKGYSIGYDAGADYTPLEWLQCNNPKTAILPKGFRKLLVETCPLACAELKAGNRVYGFRLNDIIEGNEG